MCELFAHSSLFWKTWPEEGGDRAELLLKTGKLKEPPSKSPPHLLAGLSQ